MTAEMANYGGRRSFAIRGLAGDLGVAQVRIPSAGMHTSSRCRDKCNAMGSRQV